MPLLFYSFSGSFMLVANILNWPRHRSRRRPLQWWSWRRQFRYLNQLPVLCVLVHQRMPFEFHSMPVSFHKIYSPNNPISSLLHLLLFALSMNDTGNLDQYPRVCLETSQRPIKL
ncbi:hypothetical protein L228DRAFT_3262 [Xylona heveae TC161]|uniref:Uncharacterized protein n=1 Tax=Xylona heveae (strain CBS 132557 / TC161) TaxID=1328760 RepID=A0A165JBR8_XYLHT|nr:hypothetical protein L228DRAFT_3262 [Xylona heveae TC161]KZF26022.1 hypothetical protein L228DRAFT_3262 [Xylona heveae TC161]